MPETPRILAITPNPSLDILFASDGLVWNDANRVPNPRIRPGGQGVNLARAARTLGADALVVAPLGGSLGVVLDDALRPEGILRAVPIGGQTRVFVEARDTSAGSLLLNPRGPELAAGEARALEAAALEAISELRPHFVACCGSLAPGLPVDFYARIGAAARAAGAGFVPDCDAAALAASAASATVLAPNRHEAGRLLGDPVGTVQEAVAAAARLARSGAAPVEARWAAVKLGADGAVLAAPGGVWACAAPPVPRAGSAVGAGDAFLAGMLVALAEGRDAPEVLGRAVAAGSAALMGEGTEMIEAGDARALTRLVQVTLQEG